MLWLLIIVLAYFLFSLNNLGDKYLLAGPPKPKTYTFYVSILGIAVLLLIPFINFSLPSFNQILLSFLAGACFVFAIFSFYNGLEYFEASRVIPAIGGIMPLFTFILVYLFSSGKEFLNLLGLIALFLLILGSFFITFEKEKKISFKSLPISILAAFLFSLGFILSKYVYLSQPFWSGFILMRVGGFLTALCFLFFKEIRDEIFKKKSVFQKKTGIIYLSNQVLGAGAFILQNWGINLVPLASLVFINALQGTQYLFLLILTTIFSSEKIILQKIIAVLFICAGLAVLAIK